LSTLAIPSLNSIDQYINHIRQIPNLSQEEELKLAIEYQETENQEAAMKLVIAHLKAVLPFVKKYMGYGLPQEDLIQEGNIGLMKAVKHFNPRLGYRFISFAVHWIKSEISEFVIRNWRIVKQFTTKAGRKLFFNYRSLKKDGIDRLSDTEAEEIAKELNISVKDVIEAGNVFVNTELSLNYVSTNGADEFETTLTIPDLRWEPSTVLERADEDRRIDLVRKAMDQLTVREAKIINDRWLVDDKKSLHELGAELNISYERVRQIEVLTIKKLKKLIGT
jgi:RNA polymerase sigma-32 factor